MVRALLDGTKTQTRRVVKPQPLPDAQFVGGYYIAATKLTKGSSFSVQAPYVGLACPYGKPGDQLWVRETHAIVPRSAYRCSDGVHQTLRPDDDHDAAIYRAGWERSTGGIRWRPSIHMPRWASRITLAISGVRVERLQDISEADAMAEGCKPDQPVTWWQGYKDAGNPLGLLHTQVEGDEPPDWMIEPHKMPPQPWLLRGAKTYYEILWEQINGPSSWDANPWVWVVEFKRVKP